MLQLFVLGGVNYSAFIVRDSYEVNAIEDFEEWVDADYKVHRYAMRTKIRGEFEIQFMKQSDYSAFVTALSSNRQTDGTYLPTVFVNNKNAAESITCYMSFEAGLTQDTNLQLRTPKFKVTIEQQ